MAAKCRPLCRNLGSRVHFLVKVFPIDYLEKYMQYKEKDVYNYFLQYLRHSDVTKWGTVFSLASESLYVVELFTHLK